MQSDAAKGARRLRIAFLHPDLGLGGAERLVVDAATELAAHGHNVDVYTAYYDPNRCGWGRDAVDRPLPAALQRCPVALAHCMQAC